MTSVKGKTRFYRVFLYKERGIRIAGTEKENGFSPIILLEL